MEKIAKMGIVSVLVALFCAIVPATAYADLNGTSTELTGSVEFVGPFHPGSELTAVPHPNEPYEGANFHCTWAVADDRAFTQNVMSIMNGNDPTLNLSEMFEGKYLRCTFTISGVSGELVGTTYQIIHAYWIGSMQHDASFCWMKCPYCDKRFIVEPHSFMTTDEKAAACTEDGLIVKSCSRCHYQSTETIPASGHSYSNDWSSDRDSHWKACSHCEATTAEDAHDFGEWRCVDPDAAEREVLAARACSVCGYEERGLLPASYFGIDSPNESAEPQEPTATGQNGDSSEPDKTPQGESEGLLASAGDEGAGRLFVLLAIATGAACAAGGSGRRLRDLRSGR